MSHRSALLFSHLAQNKTYSVIEKQEQEESSKADHEIIDLYIKEINRYPVLTKSQEQEYVAKAHEENCSQSRRALIESNLRLVVRIARRYQRSDYFLDLIAEGNIGLMHALNKFDITMGFRFSTYAAWWVQQYIESFLMNNSRMVRLPVYIQKKISKIRKSKEKVNQKHQRDVSARELSEEVAIDREELDKILLCQENFISLTADHQQSALECSDEELAIAEFCITDQEHDYDYEQLQNQIRSHLVGLPQHYREVIIRRFGLMGHDFMAFREIAVDLELSIDQVRQRYNNGMKRLSLTVNKNDCF